MSTTPDNPESIITQVGYYQTDNKFITLDGEIISCITYRPINQALTPEKLVAVNMRWSVELNQWVIFQYVEL